MRRNSRRLLLMGGRGLAAPVNSVLPVISGTAAQGNQLTTTDGTWAGSPAFTYQWKRDGVSIGSATANAYTLVIADVGAVITVTVTATNAAGSTNATSLGTSAVTQTYAQYLAPFVANSTLPLWLRLRETSGTTAANSGSSGATLNGTIGGTTTLGQTGLGAQGANEAFLWDALTSFIQILNNAALNALPARTLAFLCKPTSSGENTGGRFYNWGNTGASMSLNASLAVLSTILATGNAVSNSSAPLSTGVAQWLFQTYDDAGDRKIHLYRGVSGAVAELAYSTQTAATGTLTTDTGDLFMGNRLAADRTWDGLFDEVLVSTVVRDTAWMLNLVRLEGV